MNNSRTTNYTNISDIVRANRQNRLGDAVSGGVSKVIGQGQNQLQTAQNDFQQKSQQNAVGTDADKQYAQNTIQNAGQGTGQQDYDRFAQLRSGQYNGPQELGNKEQLISTGQDLSGLSNSATNQYGRLGLLQRFVAPQQQYHQGQQKLDNLLLGQTGGQALRGARQASNQFNQQLIDSDKAAQLQAQNYQRQAQQFGQDLSGQVRQAQTQQQQGLTDRTTQAQNQANASYKALHALLSRPTSVQASPPPGSITTLPIGPGFTRETISQSDFDLASPLLQQNGIGNANVYGPEYFTSSPEALIGQKAIDPTLSQVANSQDKARAEALAKLGGRQQEFLTGDATGNYNPLSFLDPYRTQFDSNLTENETKYKAASPYQQLMDGYDQNMQATGNFDRNYASRQGSAIKYLSDQTRPNDDSRANEYARLADELKAYGGGRGFLFGGAEADYFKNLYNTTIGKSNELENAYPGGSDAVRLSANGIPLLERLRGMVQD